MSVSQSRQLATEALREASTAYNERDGNHAVVLSNLAIAEALISVACAIRGESDEEDE